MANYTCTNNSYCHGSSQSTTDGASCGCGCEGASGCDCSSSEASGVTNSSCSCSGSTFSGGACTSDCSSASDLKTLLVFIAIIILLITIL
ncbi:MAG: hypothetical protein J6R60_02650 [Clostridia bacterium]|nr:hypothetical protein [Clostridia bacterium]